MKTQQQGFKWRWSTETKYSTNLWKTVIWRSDILCSANITISADMFTHRHWLKFHHPIICICLHRLSRAAHACLFGGLGAAVVQWCQSTGGSFTKWWRMHYMTLPQWKRIAKFVARVKINTETLRLAISESNVSKWLPYEDVRMRETA